jgi:hypothetical protein
MSAPPIGMMMSTPSTNDSASMAKKAVQFSVNMNTRPRPTVARPSARLSMCCPANCTGAPWNRRNLYLPDSLPNAMTEPLKVMAPMAAPRNSSSRLPAGMGWPLATIWNAQGSATAATAMNTAARPIMLCMKATSSGILVISTRWAMKAPAAPPTTSAPSTYTMPWALPPDSSTMSAAVVRMAIAMPVMPNRLPRIDVVGCDRPLSAWMKQTLATRYSSVTRFMLMPGLLQPGGRRPSFLFS